MQPLTLTSTCSLCFSVKELGTCTSCNTTTTCFFCAAPSWQVYQDVPVCLTHLLKSIDTESELNNPHPSPPRVIGGSGEGCNVVVDEKKKRRRKRTALGVTALGVTDKKLIYKMLAKVKAQMESLEELIKLLE